MAIEYRPAVISMVEMEREQMGTDHYGILYRDIVAAGPVQYGHMYVVFQRDVPEALIIIASEVNTTRELFGGGSHYLCVFDEAGHENLGDSDAYADVLTFITKALDLVTERLGIPRGPPPPQQPEIDEDVT